MLKLLRPTALTPFKGYKSTAFPLYSVSTMAHSDKNERLPSPLPLPVQMSGLPPYTAAPTTENASSIQSPIRPQNCIRISRTFGSMNKGYFTVDPNLHVPASLLGDSDWDAFDYRWSWRSKPNLELGVTFGGIQAHIEVLPSTARCPEPSSDETRPKPCPRKTGLEASTTTGNVNLHIDATHFSLRSTSTFGQIRIFLPRTYHGPIVIPSSLGAPLLSPKLKRVCTTISEVGNGRRWFVGDFGEWEQRNQHGDNMHIGTTFGRVWIGYVGEEDEAKRALRWDMLQCVVNLVFWLVVALGVHLAVKVVLWILVFIAWLF
ncbi:hypothetical protein MSAN_01088200 [Mycena sanguinolenta]|uniref:DUF7330 domain-containing protein n=1 Tax=Mycena sanguinolenta TaxID=230812 RepID=A0A8H6YQD2_9AGAR|nr:hypothetical protein MSAN_01088200 [Mycena sanguinolenta]